MSATFRIAIWFFSAVLTAMPIYVVLAPTLNDMPKLFELENYAFASKAIFFFYFSTSVAALFNLIESIVTLDLDKSWRLLVGLLILLVVFQLLVSAVYYRDVYFDKSVPSPSFSSNIFLWTIVQSFFARLFFLAGSK